MASRVRRPIRILASDRRSRRWKVPLSEEVFCRFAAEEDGDEAFGEGSLFSPRLFGKFFDPADAFPLWDFERETLLAARGKVDWGEAEDAYLLRADLPGGGNGREVEIWVDDGKVMEISRQVREATEGKDWRTDVWWEYGHVRRLELPANVDWRKAEAAVEDNVFLLVKLPKIVRSGHHSVPEANEA